MTENIMDILNKNQSELEAEIKKLETELKKVKEAKAVFQGVDTQEQKESKDESYTEMVDNITQYLNTHAKEHLDTFLKNVTSIKSLDPKEVQVALRNLGEEIVNVGSDTYTKYISPIKNDVEKKVKDLFSNVGSEINKPKDMELFKKKFIAKLLNSNIVEITYKRVRDGKVLKYLVSCDIEKICAYIKDVSTNPEVKMAKFDDIIIKNTNNENINLKQELKLCNEFNMDNEVYLYLFDINDMKIKKFDFHAIAELKIVK